MTLLQKQLAGTAGAFAAMVVAAIVFIFAPDMRPWFTLPDDNMGARLAFVATWLVWPGLMLLAGIHGAARRGFFADAIDGTRTPSNHSLEINLRYNVNTVEQIVLAAIAWAALAVVLPRDDLIVIPLMSILFVVGRVTFWIGYLLHPMARTFGMTLTVIPTIAAYVWLIWNALS